MSAIIKYDSDNLIYNRYDKIFSNYEELIYDYEGDAYKFMLCVQKGRAYINLWGKYLPQELFEQIMSCLLERDDIYRLSLLRCKNNYMELLEKTNDFELDLPKTIDALFNRLKAKHRYNINREKRIICEKFGNISSRHYPREKIENNIVELYFSWKKASHKTDYKMSSEEYLDYYHVTDLLEVEVGNQIVGIAFYCRVDDTAFFENFSYDSKFTKYSIGHITYEILLEHLIEQKVKKFFLGGGNYDYKRRFGSVETEAYLGHLYSKKSLKNVNDYFLSCGIRRIVIYGFGKYGHEFLRILKAGLLNVQLLGIIDKKKINEDSVNTYTIDDNIPDADGVVITLKNKYESVEKLLKERYEYVFYMNDIFEGLS